MSRYQAVIVEDDLSVREILEISLRQINFGFSSFGSAEDYLSSGNFAAQSIYVIDLELPGMSGLDLIKAIRSKNRLAYILIISGSTDIDDLTVGFNSGADDYMGKPFIYSHLLMKLQNAKAKLLSFSKSNLNEGIKFFANTNSILLKGKDISVTDKEFYILKELYSHKGELVSKNQFSKGLGEGFLAHNIDMHIHSLRKKIQTSDIKIENVRGSGYKLTGAY